jgi:acylphosphatase
MVLSIERRTIHYAGRVQGVGFRWTALRALDGLALTGYVRNLRDGRVELVIEGEPEQTNFAAERVRTAMVGMIEAEDATVSAPTGEFGALRIRR